LGQRIVECVLSIWDPIRGKHQGQRQLRCIKQAGHKTAPDLMSKLQKILAMQEPSTQDILVNSTWGQNARIGARIAAGFAHSSRVQSCGVSQHPSALRAAD
jgi:hypothetical protein